MMMYDDFTNEDVGNVIMDADYENTATQRIYINRFINFLSEVYCEVIGFITLFKVSPLTVERYKDDA